VPQWSGVIVAAIFVPLVAAPYGLGVLARRYAGVDRTKPTAICLRLASYFHPTQPMRFQAGFMAAYALGPVDQKVSAYGALARSATPEQIALLNIWTALARNDWIGVLDQVEGVTVALRWLEVLALGQLGRVDDMIAACAQAQRGLGHADRLHCWLYVLAFSGRVAAVRALLNREMRYLSPEKKAYWSAIVASAAGADDEEPRRALARYADTSTDATFRLAAQRYLAEGAPRQAGALSGASLATIASIEQTLR
jgi:hypothetical protein